MVVDGSFFLTLPDLLMQGLLINKFGPAIGRDVIFDVPGEILIIIFVRLRSYLSVLCTIPCSFNLLIDNSRY